MPEQRALPGPRGPEHHYGWLWHPGQHLSEVVERLAQALPAESLGIFPLI
jgi:hypothetical protein